MRRGKSYFLTVFCDSIADVVNEGETVMLRNKQLSLITAVNEVVELLYSQNVLDVLIVLYCTSTIK